MHLQTSKRTSRTINSKMEGRHLEIAKPTYTTLATLRGSFWFVIGHIISCQLIGTILAPTLRKKDMFDKNETGL